MKKELKETGVLKKKHKDDCVIVKDGRVLIPCVACECLHSVNILNTRNEDTWRFNNNLVSPTLTPAIKIQYAGGHVCSSLVINGKIKYLSESTHNLAGKTRRLIIED